MIRALKWIVLACLLHAASYAVPMPYPAVEIPEVIRAATDTLRPQPPYRFTSDGCSGFLSLGWRLIFGTAPPFEDCCVEHDVCYWRGGSAAARLRADRSLLQCVEERGYPLLASIMWAAVRVGGIPQLPTPYRFGYGHPFFTPYSEQ